MHSQSYVQIDKTAENEQRKFRQIAQMKKNVAMFNSQLQWQLVGIQYNQITNTYSVKNAIITIMYETSQTGSRTNKLKVGQATIDLAAILNQKNYRIHNYYSLQKCYDQAAKIKLAIDLTKIEEAAIRSGGEHLANDEYTRLKQAMDWRTSKIKQRIVDEQKNIIQNKLFEYEDKMEKYRDSHNQQIRRLNDQIQKKQQKISILSQQNNSIANALQTLQITTEKQKSHINTLEQQLKKLKQVNRQTSTGKDSINNELVSTQNELNQLTYKLEQSEKTKEKKQQYYKAELQKYNKKYLQTENARNRIVFEMQSKLKQELEHKDSYYKKLIQKLQEKLTSHSSQSKQVYSKTHKQYIVIKQSLDKSQRQKIQLNLELQQLTVTRDMLQNIKEQHQKKIGQLQDKIRNLNSQNQMSEFSSNNLIKENSKLKAESKVFVKSIDDLKYQIQLANRTIQENEQNMVKLHRQLKVHKERQYYMEEKFQDQLQIKTYNQQCMRGTNNHYRNEVKKLALKIRLYEQKLDQAEQVVSSLNRQKQKLHDQLKRNSQSHFQLNQKHIRLESEIKSLKISLGQSNQSCHSLELQLLEVQKSYESLETRYENLQNQYEHQISSNSQRIYSLQERMRQQKQQYEYSLTSDLSAKNTLLTAIQQQLKKVKDNNTNLQVQIRDKQLKLQQAENINRLSMQKCKNLQKQASRAKVQLQRSKQIEQKLNKDLQKHKKQNNNIKQELSLKINQCSAIQKKIYKVKQAYGQLIKWMLDRVGVITVFNTASTNSNIVSNREYIQSIQGQVQMDTVYFVNNGLERIYNQWDKISRKLAQVTQELDRRSEELARVKLDVEHQANKIYGTGLQQNKFEQQLQAITMKINSRPSPQSNIIAENELQYVNSMKIEELKRQNKHMQNQINQKNYDVQLVRQQLQTEKNNCYTLKSEIKDLKDEIEDLRNSLSKKNIQLNSYQFQTADRYDDYSLNSYHLSRSPSRSRQVDYKSDVEVRYRQKKALEQSEAKNQQLVRENTLHRAKLQLLQSKLKTSSENQIALQQKISNLKQQNKVLGADLRKYQKLYDNSKQTTDNHSRQLELVNTRLLKKDKQLDVVRQQLLVCQKSVDVLTNKLEESSSKSLEQLKLSQKECSQLKDRLLQSDQLASKAKIEAEGLRMQIRCLCESSDNNKKQYQAKIVVLQSVVGRNNKQHEQLYNKYVSMVGLKSECEQKMKDEQMQRRLTEDRLKKQIIELQERIESKENEYEQLKFTSESRIIQLQRQLEDGILRNT